jgi:hypothetical protein
MRASKMRRGLVTFIAGALMVSACGGGDEDQAAAASKKATTTTKPRPPVAPLTGLADPGGVAAKRCAVTVKIDNTQAGHPKYNVDQADLVYEEVVEGGITRLAAVFNSKNPDRVGPVRSVRKSDHLIVTPLRGVFAYSGGAPDSVQSISQAPVVRLDESAAGDAMFRDSSRNAPWNLYANVDRMYGSCKDPAPAPQFAYRDPKTPVVAGTPVVSALVNFRAGFEVRWTWDAPSATWKRRIFGGPEMTASGLQLAPQNVVMIFAPYAGGDPRPQYFMYGAEAQLVGTGKLMVLTGGKLVEGTWSRASATAPTMLRDPAGKEIRLAPGQTWVELPEPSYTVDIEAVPAAPTTTTP